MLDTVLGDDASRTRAGHAAQTLTCIRLSALNLARRLGQSVGMLCREHALKTNLLLHRLRIFRNWPAVGFMSRPKDPGGTLTRSVGEGGS